ncbi:MAG: NrsF family protein [Amaricoccus sp.]|uniref:NrsF family protein n=1 Tax=Amaricoccus sp. TaxID=1872485 RepID=UPI0039E64989
MRTDELVRALAADPTPGRSVAAGLGVALVAGGAVVLAAVVGLLGLRPDLIPALATLPVAVKQA